MRAVVEAAGSDLSHVLSVDVFLIDMGRFAEFNQIYSTFFTTHKPARAAVAVGADGVIVEIHPEPEKAFSDGPQSLRPEQFYRLMDEVGILQEAMGRLAGGRP